jgi:peptidylprolyl isomerase
MKYTLFEQGITTPMAVGIGVVGLVVMGGLLYILQRQESSQETIQPEDQIVHEQPVLGNGNEVDTTGLIMEDIVEGSGHEVIAGDVIQVHYRGTLEDGSVFDSSYEKEAPFQTQIGVGQVIKGWDIGMEGMKVGGKRMLTIPPHLGYGEAGVPGVIPANAILQFEVELIDIIDIKG